MAVKPARLSRVEDESAGAAPAAHAVREDADLDRLHARLDELIDRLDRLEREGAAQAAEIGSSLTYVHAELEKLRRQLAKTNFDHVVLDDDERAAIADAVLERINEAFEVTAEIDAEPQPG
jgi:hypothetical protein